MKSLHLFTQVLVNQQKMDFKRTPLLVRRLKVTKALHWLKLNHIDYYDCEISDKNLASYPEEGPPVVVDYYSSSLNKNPRVNKCT